MKRNNIIKLALEEIRAKKPDAPLDPEQIVVIASNKDNPLHKYFEWDDKKAGHQYRVWQARKLLSEITVDDEEGIREYQSFYLEVQEGKKRGYWNVDTIMNDDDLRRAVLRQALRDAKAYLNKYRRYKEIFEIVNQDVIARLEQELLQ